MRLRRAAQTTGVVVMVLVAVLYSAKSFLPSPYLVEVTKPASHESVHPDAVRAYFTIEPLLRIQPHETVANRLSLLAEVKLTHMSTEPIRDFTAIGWFDDSLRPWIGSGILSFGMDVPEAKPMVFRPGEVPYGLVIFRIADIPNPTTLTSTDRTEMLRALQGPLWLKLTWDRAEYLIMIPAEMIETEGFELVEAAS